MVEKPPPPPAGAERIAAWARAERLVFHAWPDQAWFAAWEPFDLLVGAGAWFSAASFSTGRAHVTLVEPWYAEPGLEPLERTALAFVTHPGFTHRVAVRSGEHFNTRVAFVVEPPMPRVEVGDRAWDPFVVTHAASGSEAARALPVLVRQFLAEARFQGHLELRPGGLVLHQAGLSPTPEGYGSLRGFALALLGAFFRTSGGVR